MEMYNIYGKCSSCGNIVKGKKGFIHPISFHCDIPPCWPISLWIMDSIWKEKIKEIINKNDQE